MGFQAPRKLFKGALLLYVVQDQTYKDTIINLVKISIRKFRNICFIALNRSHESLAFDFIRSGIDARNIFFVDAVGKTAQQDLKVLLLPSPYAFLEMDTGIEEIIIGEGAECFIFDSLSTLLAYGDSLALSKFINAISQKIKTSNMCGIFTCLKKDISSNLISDLSMFADEVVNV